MMVNPDVFITPIPNPIIANDELIWNFFKEKGLNEFAIAGLMGNLFAESGLRPTALEKSKWVRTGHNDDTYTPAVDDGTYTNFINDGAGYGLAQWTFHSRKRALLNFSKSVMTTNTNKTAKTSVGDLAMQLDFMWKELQGYTSVMDILHRATSVRQASDVVLFEYERPADQGAAVQEKRASYGMVYYNKFAVNNNNEQSEDEDMTQKKFNEMLSVALSEMATRQSSDWSKEAREWAVSIGLFSGDGKGNFSWQGLISREQAAQLFYNIRGKI
jgi:hypothetical protein